MSMEVGIRIEAYSRDLIEETRSLVMICATQSECQNSGNQVLYLDRFTYVPSKFTTEL